MKYQISMSWIMNGSVVVEADSLEDAKSIAWEIGRLPTNGDFIQGSFSVDEEGHGPIDNDHYKSWFLMDTEIWKTKFNFQDIYDSAGDDWQNEIDNISNDELERFIESYKHKMAKELESGIMFGWDEVARTIASDIVPQAPIEGEPA